MKENKTKKGHENIIGKIIYGFLLFMPLIAIGSTLLISTFNDQAKQESEINYRFKTNDIVYNSDLVVGNYYAFDFDQFYKNGILNRYVFQEENSYIRFDNCYLPVDYELDFPYEFNYYEADNPMPFHNGLTIECGINYNDTDYLFFGLFDSYNGGIDYSNDLHQPFYTRIYGRLSDFTFHNYNNMSNLSDYIHKCPLDKLPIDHVETHNVDAKILFYDSIAKVEQSEYFNWATNTTIYTGVATTTTLLGITTTFIPFILTYWLLITVAYLIYDIALMLLLITHRKIHEIQESI